MCYTTQSSARCVLLKAHFDLITRIFFYLLALITMQSSGFVVMYVSCNHNFLTSQHTSALFYVLNQILRKYLCCHFDFLLLSACACKLFQIIFKMKKEVKVKSKRSSREDNVENFFEIYNVKTKFIQFFSSQLNKNYFERSDLDCKQHFYINFLKRF